MSAHQAANALRFDSIRSNIYGFFVFFFCVSEWTALEEESFFVFVVQLVYCEEMARSLCVGTFPFAVLPSWLSAVLPKCWNNIRFAFAILDQDIIFYQWQLFIGPSLFSRRQATSSTSGTHSPAGTCASPSKLLFFCCLAINTEFLIYLLLINATPRPLISWHNRYQWPVNLLALKCRAQVKAEKRRPLEAWMPSIIRMKTNFDVCTTFFRAQQLGGSVVLWWWAAAVTTQSKSGDGHGWNQISRSLVEADSGAFSDSLSPESSLSSVRIIRCRPLGHRTQDMAKAIEEEYKGGKQREMQQKANWKAKTKFIATRHRLINIALSATILRCCLIMS